MDDGIKNTLKPNDQSRTPFLRCSANRPLAPPLRLDLSFLRALSISSVLMGQSRMRSSNPCDIVMTLRVRSNSLAHAYFNFCFLFLFFKVIIFFFFFLLPIEKGQRSNEIRSCTSPGCNSSIYICTCICAHVCVLIINYYFKKDRVQRQYFDF